MPTGDYRRRPPTQREQPSGNSGRKRPQKDERNRVQLGMMLGAFLLAVILLVVCIVMIFQAIFAKKESPASSGNSGTNSLSASGVTPGNVPGVLAPNPDDPLLMIVSDAFPADESLSRSSSELTGVVSKGATYYVDSRIYDELMRMMNDCNAIEGNALVFVSGYRSYKYQSEQYNYFYTNYKIQGLSDETAQSRAREEYLPGGRSENQTGLAVDFATATVPKNSAAFAQTSEYQWLVANAHNYGFILRYAEGKQEITGMPYQPFHFRYVGMEHAKAIVDAGITLEEYVGKAPYQLEQQPASQPTAGDATASG